MCGNLILRRIAPLLWLPAVAYSQVAGTISGFVTAASGGPVPSAKVTALLVEQQLQIPQSPTGTLTTFGSQPRQGDMGLARIDWNASTRHTVSGHAFVDRNLLNRLNLVSGSLISRLSRISN